MVETSKETKAQRAERLKAALNPWSAYSEIERFAREGWDSIPPEWLNTHFRWWGIYTQGDGVGAVGGTGGEFCKIALTETKGFAHRLGAGVGSPRSEVPEAIEWLLRAYLGERGAGENFRQYCAAHTDEELRNALAGELVESVERDVAFSLSAKE